MMIRFLVALICLLLVSLDSYFAFPLSLRERKRQTQKNEGGTGPAALQASQTDCLQVQLNEFFKTPVPYPIKNALSIYNEDDNELNKDSYSDDIITFLTAAPSSPGFPRQLWLVILASLPTGLLWYGYYKFAVEEELLQIELNAGKQPRGLGGYGTLGPFSYGMLLVPLAAMLHIPGGIYWAIPGIIFIYYTQFLLYDRVNELYSDEGLNQPLQAWWCLPIFFPFNLVVGLRQIHFLAQYYYFKRGITPPEDPIVKHLPFISADSFTWQEFLLSPSLWCSALSDFDDIDPTRLPKALQDLLKLDRMMT